MSYENKPWTGALFKNDYKNAENHPDFKGPFYVALDGQVIEFEIAGWTRESKGGKKYISLKAGERREPKKGGNRPAAGDTEEMSDDIPF